MNEQKENLVSELVKETGKSLTVLCQETGINYSRLNRAMNSKKNSLGICIELCEKIKEFGGYRTYYIALEAVENGANVKAEIHI